MSKFEKSKADHFESFSGWRNIASEGQPLNLIGHFKSNQEGLIGPHSLPYTPSAVVVKLEEHLVRPLNRGFTDRDVGMMEGAVTEALAKIRPSEARTALQKQWDTYCGHKAEAEAVRKSSLETALQSKTQASAPVISQ